MSLLTTPNEIPAKTTFSGLIYGQPGIGKTTLALSAPNPVCIDTDKGIYRVEKRFQVPSLQVEDYQQVLDLIQGNELNPFDTLVIDTLGKLIDRTGDYIVKNNPKYRQSNGQLTMQGWGQVKFHFASLLKLIQGKGKSVIFVAHESEEKNGEQIIKRPDVSGPPRKDIVKELDWMGYMSASSGKRVICFTPSEAFYAKNAAGLEGVLEIPDTKNGNSFIRDVIVKSIQKRQEKDNQELELYLSLKQLIDDEINQAKTKEALNAAFDKITSFETIWDSKYYAWNQLNEKASALNLYYNKEEKHFEQRA